MGLVEFLKAYKPLFGAKRQQFRVLRQFLHKPDLKKLRVALNQNRISFTNTSLGISKNIGLDFYFPTVALKVTDSNTKTLVDDLNNKIEQAVTQSYFKEFSKKADQIIPKFVAHKLHGLKNVKLAIALQMFAKDRIHILLLGDPGTGKTEFLQSAEELYPRTSFGLGSGTTGVGLAVTIKGKKVKPGLLPSANNGICCIDELNLMKKDDYAALYSAMEKGFITYDKGGEHHKFDANVRLLATANPIGDKFRGTTRDAVIRQLPFEPALLSRFTLVFLIRKPDLKGFMEIAGKIVDKSKQKLNQADIDFIQRYIEISDGIEVDFPKRFKGYVLEFSKEIKLRESELFFEISPRLIHGLINISKAFARMGLRKEVTFEDLKRARMLLLKALENKVA